MTAPRRKARSLARRVALELSRRRRELERAADGAEQVAGIVRALAETVEDGARRVGEVLRRAPRGVEREWEDVG